MVGYTVDLALQSYQRLGIRGRISLAWTPNSPAPWPPIASSVFGHPTNPRSSSTARPGHLIPRHGHPHDQHGSLHITSPSCRVTVIPWNPDPLLPGITIVRSNISSLPPPPPIPSLIPISDTPDSLGSVPWSSRSPCICFLARQSQTPEPSDNLAAMHIWFPCTAPTNSPVPRAFHSHAHLEEKTREQLMAVPTSQSAR